MKLHNSVSVFTCVCGQNVKESEKNQPNPVDLLVQRFPTLLHLHTPWQPISINCTLHFSKMFVINTVTFISNLSCLTLLTYVPFSAIIQFLFRVHLKCPDSYRWGYAFPILGITVLVPSRRIFESLCKIPFLPPVLISTKVKNRKFELSVTSGTL